MMKSSSPFLVVESDDCLLVRVCGKANFQNSLILKRYVEKKIDSIRSIIIDLAECLSMDSTFIGTLASLSRELEKKFGDKLKVFSAQGRNLEVLQELGVHFVLDVNPKSESLKKFVQKFDKSSFLCIEANSVNTYRKHVLEAHETLINQNEGNRQRFSSLIEQLKEESEKG